MKNSEVFEEECRLLEKTDLKNNPYRKIYEEEVRSLGRLAADLREKGYSTGMIASRLFDCRNKIMQAYRELAPSVFRRYIYSEIEKEYGNPKGPTFKQLMKTKTFDEIIESACRPFGKVDERITLDGFIRWYEEGK